MRIKTVGNKGDSISIVVRNAEASATIPLGTPVCFVGNGTNDGLDVVLPATGGATKAHALAAGVIITPGGIIANAYGEAVAYGVVGSVIITRNTRAATTDSWSTSASIASYGTMSIDTINNAMLVSSAGSQAATAYLPFAVLLQSVAAAVGSASATSDARTVVTASVKAFLRMI